MSVQSLVSDSLEIVSHVIGWGIPIIVTIIPAATRSYGNLGTYCWIKGDELGTWLRLSLNYIPLWVVIALSCILYIIAIVAVSRAQWHSYRYLEKSKRFSRISSSMRLFMKLVCIVLSCITVE